MQSASGTGRTIEQRLSLVAFAAVTALIIIFLLTDVRAFVSSARDEHIGHLGASAGFTVAASGTFLTLRRERPSLLTILLIGSAITIAGELAQGLVPRRGIEALDIVTGFGGVLIAAVCIEFVLFVFSRPAARRVHTVAAASASVILLVMLVFDLAPVMVSDVRPDGERCALTTIDGSGQRVVLGSEAVAVDSCLLTGVGGLGLFGPHDSNSLSDDSGLLSSPLGQLASRILEGGTITVTTEFVTDSFADDRDQGIITLLRSHEVGDLLQIRTRNQVTEVIGPNFPSRYQTLSYSQVLEPDTRHQLRVELTVSELVVYVDDKLVATNTVDSGWFQAFANVEAAGDLTLYIGNGPSQTLPFKGVIEWIEIDA